MDRKTLLFDRGVLRLEDRDWLYWNDELLVGTPAGPGPEQRQMGGKDMAACFETQLTEFARAIRGQPHRSVLHEDGCRLIETIDRIRRAALTSNPLLE